MKEAKTLNSLLEETRVAERRKHNNFMAEIARHKKESDERRKKVNELLKGKLRQARVKDYKNWLAGFLEKGNKPTHCYEYPLERGMEEWKVACSDFQILPLFGANSLQIIIPKGIKFLGGELGHSNLYFMDDFSCLGGWVPIYSDIHF
ncbi:hypothetical protein ES703_108765 [subsurface metagenome]